MILERLNNILVSVRAGIKTQVCWLQRVSSKSLQNTVPKCYVRLHALKVTAACWRSVCLSREDTNKECDKTFRLEWLSTTWDTIAAIKLWKKPDSTGRIIAIDSDKMRSESVIGYFLMSTGHEHHAKGILSHNKQGNPKGRKNEKSL